MDCCGIAGGGMVGEPALGGNTHSESNARVLACPEMAQKTNHKMVE